MASDDSRRAFFRQLVDRTLGEAADFLGDQLGPAASPTSRQRLRPPGAIIEAAFLETCYRCGNCVDVCPAQAIQHTRDSSEELNGTPYIDAARQPCLVCDGLECMQACPSGALQLLSQEQIRMGRAVVDHAACLRTAGEDCRRCVDLCPLGEAALRLDDGGAVAVGSACIGCGICEWKCPTTPRSVTVAVTQG